MSVSDRNQAIGVEKSDFAKALAATRVPSTLRAPSVFDDTTRGYSVSQYWFDGAAKQWWQALDVTANAAVWQQVPMGRVLPLDVVATAIGAYGMVKLRAAYAGSCLQVIRASDSATLDVGFVYDAQVGASVVDAAALDAFLAGTTGKVTKWYDQSGNANDAAQTVDANRPQIAFNTINGVRAMVFDGRTTTNGTVAAQNVYFDLPVGFAANTTAYSGLSLGRIQSLSQSGGLFSLGAPDAVMFQSFSNQLSYYDGASSNAFALRGVTDPAVFGLVSAAGSITAHCDEATASLAAATSAAKTGGKLGSSSAAGFPGCLEALAMVFYARALSATEVRNLKFALYALGNVSLQFDARVVYDGDSITRGVTGCPYMQDRPSTAWRRYRRPVSRVNTGTDAQTVQTAVGIFSGVAGAVYAPSRLNILSVLYGTNDIAGGRTAAQLIADLTSYWALAKAAGYTILAGTILPRTSFDAAKQTIWTTVNAFIRASAGSLFDYLIDYQASPTMGPFAAASDTTLYVDGTHPTVKGQQIMAAIEAAVVNTALGYPPKAW